MYVGSNAGSAKAPICANIWAAKIARTYGRFPGRNIRQDVRLVLDLSAVVLMHRHQLHQHPLKECCPCRSHLIEETELRAEARGPLDRKPRSDRAPARKRRLRSEC